MATTALRASSSMPRRQIGERGNRGLAFKTGIGGMIRPRACERQQSKIVPTVTRETVDCQGLANP